MILQTLMKMIISVKFICVNESEFFSETVDLAKHGHRYESIQQRIEQHQSNTHGFLIAGHLDEERFCEKWQEKVNRIHLSILFHYHSSYCSLDELI